MLGVVILPNVFHFVDFGGGARVKTENDSALAQSGFIVLNRFFRDARTDLRADQSAGDDARARARQSRR